MPIGGFINVIPPALFLLVHLVIFLVAAYAASRSFGAGAGTLGWGFVLFAIGELIYMTYHLDWTVFLFAHTLAEVCNLIGFILVLVGASAFFTTRARSATTATAGAHT